MRERWGIFASDFEDKNVENPGHLYRLVQDAVTKTVDRRVPMTVAQTQSRVVFLFFFLSLHRKRLPVPPLRFSRCIVSNPVRTPVSKQTFFF